MHNRFDSYTDRRYGAGSYVGRLLCERTLLRADCYVGGQFNWRAAVPNEVVLYNDQRFTALSAKGMHGAGASRSVRGSEG